MASRIASTDLFIDIIRRNRTIYDKSSKDFKLSTKKEQAWLRVAGESRMTVETAKKRYFTLRQKYTREKKKIELSKRSGKASTSVGTWVWYDRLSFLNDFISPRSTYTNDYFDMDDPDNNNLDEMMGDESTERQSQLSPIHAPQNNARSSISPRRMSSLDIFFSSPPRRLNDSFISIRERSPPIRRLHSEDISDLPRSESRGSFNFCRRSELSSRDSRREDSNSLQDQYDYGQHRHDLGYERSSVSRDNSSAMFRTPISQLSRPTISRDVSRYSSSSMDRTPISHFPRSTSRGVSSYQNSSTPISRPSTHNPGTQGVKRVPDIAEIKNNMNAFLTTAHSKLHEKPARSQHSSFLSFIGSELERVPSEKIQLLKKEMVDLIFKYSSNTANETDV